MTVRTNLFCWASILVLGLAVVALSTLRHARRDPLVEHSGANDKREVEVIAVLEAYLGGPTESGRRSSQEPVRSRDVAAFVFRVTAPDALIGTFFGLHHDGDLASGSAFELYKKGRKYRFTVPQSELVRRTPHQLTLLYDGRLPQLSFPLCSLRPLGIPIDPGNLMNRELTTRSTERACTDVPARRSP